MRGIISMMGKTHLAVGISTSLLFMQPKTKSEMIISVIGGAIGGIMSDVDVKIDKSNKFAQKASMDALYGEITAIVLTVVLLIADYIGDGGICTKIIEAPMLPAIGAGVFIVLTIIGELSKHRDKTHSLLFMILCTIAVVLINISLGVAFFIGFASHLSIDLFNKQPIRLLYPLKKGICFKLCYADRVGNELFFSIGVGIIGLYLTLGTVIF